MPSLCFPFRVSSTVLAFFLLVGFFFIDTNNVVFAKECGTVSRGKQVKALVQSSHVLVVLTTADEDEDEDEDDTDGNGDEASTGLSSSSLSPSSDPVIKDLCERFHQTPEGRVSDFEIVVATDRNVQRKVWEQSYPTLSVGNDGSGVGMMIRQFVIPKLETLLPVTKKWTRSLPSSTVPSLSNPAFVLFPKGTSFEKADGIQFIPTDYSAKTEGIIDENDDEEHTTVLADDVSNFVAKTLGRKKIGNYVYSLSIYDVMAAGTMKLLQKYGAHHILTRGWVYGVGKLTQYFIQPTTMSFEKELAQIYVQSAIRILKEGDAETPERQIARLERLLSASSSDNQNTESASSSASASISATQREKLGQRLYIWRKFAEPMELEEGDMLKMFGRLVFNVLSVLLILILIPFLLFTTDEEEEYDEIEDEVVESDKKETETDTESNDVDKAVENDMKDTSDDQNTIILNEPKKDIAEKGPTSTTSKSKVEETTTDPKRKPSIAEMKARAKASMAADKARVQAVKAGKFVTPPSNTTSNGSNIGGQKYTASQLEKMTVLQLREILREENLTLKGLKSELIQRILNHRKD